MATQTVEELPEGLINASHRISTQIEVYADGVLEQTITATDGEDNKVLSGSVTLDSDAGARGRISLTVAGIGDMVPTDAASLLNVYGNEIRGYRGIKTAADTYLVPLGVFLIDRSTASDPNDGGTVVTVSGRDRAGSFISPEGGFEAAGQVASGTEAGQAMVDILLEADPDLDYDADAFAALVVPLPLVNFEEGGDRWGFVSGIATACGHELFFDRTGRATIQPIPQATEDSWVADISDGEGGTLLSIERDWDRSRVINRWTVTGQNPSNDVSSAVPRGVAVDDNSASPTYYYGQNTSGKTFGRRSNSYDNSFITDSTQAADAARGLLARTIGAPDSISLSAICDPARSPSDVVNVERSRVGLNGAVHILDQVEIPLDPEGEMTLSTRITQTF